MGLDKLVGSEALWNNTESYAVVSENYLNWGHLYFGKEGKMTVSHGDKVMEGSAILDIYNMSEQLEVGIQNAIIIPDFHFAFSYSQFGSLFREVLVIRLYLEVPTTDKGVRQELRVVEKYTILPNGSRQNGSWVYIGEMHRPSFGLGVGHDLKILRVLTSGIVYKPWYMGVNIDLLGALGLLGLEIAGALELNLSNVGNVTIGTPHVFSADDRHVTKNASTDLPSYVRLADVGHHYINEWRLGTTHGLSGVRPLEFRWHLPLVRTDHSGVVRDWDSYLIRCMTSIDLQRIQ